MAIPYRRLAAIIAAVALISTCVWILPPVKQNPLYHAFADTRTILGVPNFWNVISNAPFLLVALYGMRAFRSRTAFSETWERIAYGALLAGTAAVGVGSAFYHLHPDDARLFWDRLPMTVVFMSLVATTIGERMSMNAGKLLLIPMICLGVSAVIYWRNSGDLRFYGVIQFGSMLALPLLLALFPPRYSGTGGLWCTFSLYVFAKILELLDREVASVVATGGHPWKHLAAAGGILIYVSAVAGRRQLRQSSLINTNANSADRRCEDRRTAVKCFAHVNSLP